MKVLQIGAGSMGKRRMRDLTARGDMEIALLEGRDDRREFAIEKFGLKTSFSELEDAINWKPDIMIISSGPGTHRFFIEVGLENGFNTFCEASLFGYDYKAVEKVDLKVIPSTLPDEY